MLLSVCSEQTSTGRKIFSSRHKIRSIPCEGVGSVGMEKKPAAHSCSFTFDTRPSLGVFSLCSHSSTDGCLSQNLL